MNYYACPPFQHPPCSDLAETLMKAMQGEMDAIKFYAYLIQQAPDKFQQEIITGIREDEEKHLNNFQTVYCMLTGRIYELPEKEPTLPTNYMEGLLNAFKDEQEAYELYKTNYLCNNDPNIRNSYWDAMMDEAEHGRWFNNLLIRYMKDGHSNHHHH